MLDDICNDLCCIIYHGRSHNDRCSALRAGRSRSACHDSAAAPAQGRAPHRRVATAVWGARGASLLKTPSSQRRPFSGRLQPAGIQTHISTGGGRPPHSSKVAHTIIPHHLSGFGLSPCRLAAVRLCGVAGRIAGPGGEHPARRWHGLLGASVAGCISPHMALGSLAR